jgi:murein DD-endopeptidase MepM/ murein hydrolase activator NlpD
MRKTLGVLVLLLASLFFVRDAFAADNVRVAGFGYPRNEYPFDNPFFQWDISYVSEIVFALNDQSNFGDGGVVPCEVSMLPFVNTVSSGSLVSGGHRTADVFIVGTLASELSALEASELKSFLENGGVVFISSGTDDISNVRYSNFFEALGFSDRFTGEEEELSFAGISSVPVDSPIVNGKFGKVHKLSHYPFRIINFSTLMPVALGFEEIDGFATLSLGTQSQAAGELKPLLLEKEFGSGYLSVAGTSLYLNDYSPENVKYFMNLIGHACKEQISLQPFLDLPWDYGAKGMSFSTAALSMSAYFDHEYPLLSASGLNEPSDSQNTTTIFKGLFRTGFDYSSHDGYDWGRLAKTKEGTPVLAAAGGSASFKGVCGPCGNAILIDHGNGFQTRYYHLRDDGLAVNQPGQTVQVGKGQQIGLVGHTGNVKPGGEAGSHIHFMVIQDKNGDGNFEDNIPDGMVDPFGWQSNDPDPWPNYAFFYNGQQRTGNASHYLWTSAIANLSEEFDSNGAFFNLEHYGASFPPGFTNETYKVNMKAGGGITIPYETVGYPLDMTIVDGTGNPVTHFPTPFTLTIDFSGFDISRLIQETLSVYSSEDGISWVKEDATFDWDSKVATFQTDHASYFVLAGERMDTTAPTTTAEIFGTQGESDWFRSDVEVVLNSEDNEGGFGVEYTSYKLDDGDWQEYLTPLTVVDEGEHEIQYFSVDNEENVEEVKSTVFYIDKTAPEVSISFNPESLSVEGVGVDEGGQTTTQFEKTGLLKAKFTVSDTAGNTLALEGSYLHFLRSTTFSISSVKYNSVSHSPGSNRYNALYATDRKTKKLSSLNQTWIEEGLFVNIFYYAKEGKSYIYIKEDGQVTVNTSQNGLVILYIETDSGNLKYRYE